MVPAMGTPAGAAVQTPPMGTVSSPSNATTTDAQDDDSFASIASTARRNFSRATQRRFKPSTSVFDIFDWKFERYVTPWVIRFTWMAIVGLTATWFLAAVIALLVTVTPEFKTDTSKDSSTRSSSKTLETPNKTYEQTEYRPTTTGYRFDSGAVGRNSAQYLLRVALAVFAFLTAMVMMMIFLLWVRVVLESVIVLFNMAETLTSIDRALGKD